MKRIQAVARFIDFLFSGLTKTMEIAAGIGLLILMLLTVYDVGNRKFGGAGIASIIAIVLLAMVVVVYFGMSGAEAAGVHVRTPLLTARLPPRIRRVVIAIGLGISVAVLLLICYATAIQAKDSYMNGEITDGVERYHVWPERLSIAVGLFVFAVRRLIKLIKVIRGSDENLGREEVEVEAVLTMGGGL